MCMSAPSMPSPAPVVAPPEVPKVADAAVQEARTSALKQAALQAFGLVDAHAADYLVKLHGAEVLGEIESIAHSGARDGSTYLLAHRLRRPVR